MPDAPSVGVSDSGARLRQGESGPSQQCESGSISKGGGGGKVVKRTYDGLSFSKVSLAPNRSALPASRLGSEPRLTLSLLFQFMISGSAAGIAEHVAMFPVDTVKTRMQALAVGSAKIQSTSRAMTSIIRSEGLMGLYNGVGAVAVGAGPSHGLYFVVYEYMKTFLGADEDRHRPLETSLAAAAATIVADAFMTPLDVVKQRLQLPNSPYKGALDCAGSMLRNEGVRAFFKSYNTTVIMNVPFVSIHFAAYESCKKILRKSPEDEGLGTQIVAGGFAGGLAALATNPLDMVKTRLQTEGVLSDTRYKTSSSFGVLRKIVSTEGYAALMHGMGPRVMFHVPAAAISWMTYETCKKFLTR